MSNVAFYFLGNSGFRALALVPLIGAALLSTAAMAGDRPDKPLNDGDPNDCHEAGNPINIATGNKFQMETDITHDLPLGNNLRLDRYYNSRGTAYSHGNDGFGAKWTHSYGMRMHAPYTSSFVNGHITYCTTRTIASLIGDVYLHHGDGKIQKYAFNDTGYANSSSWDPRPIFSNFPYISGYPDAVGYNYCPPPREHIPQTSVELLQSVSVIMDDGRRVTFEYLPVSTEYWHDWMYPTTIESQSGGDITTLEYDADRRLVRVKNALTGQRIDFFRDDAPASQYITRVRDQSGREWKYDYDGSGRLFEVENPDGDLRTYTYNTEPQGAENHYNLLTLTDERNILYSTWEYTSHRRAKSSFLAGNVNRVDIEYIGANHSTLPPNARVVTNAYGRDSTYKFSEYLEYWNFTEITGEQTTNCASDVQSREYYPTYGDVSASIGKAGDRTEYTYKRTKPYYGMIETIKEATGEPEERTHTFAWTGYWHLPSSYALSDQYRIQYSYDNENRRLTRITMIDKNTSADPYSTENDQRVWVVTYTYYDYVFGGSTQFPTHKKKPKTITVNGPRTDGAPDTTTYHYSETSRLTKIVNALGHETLFSLHNALGQPRRVIDANGVETLLEYSTLGWLESAREDPYGINATTIFGYDEIGQLTSVTLPDATGYTLVYDNARRLVEIKNGLQEKIKITPDVASNWDLIEFLDSTGTSKREVDYDFDDLGRVLKRLGNYGQSIGYGYDGTGQLKTISDGVNSPKTLVKDKLDRATSIIDPSGTVGVVNDEADRITQVTDQRSVITQYKYSGFGDLKQVVSPDAGTTTYLYDDAGNVTRKTDARGIVANYSYDPLNRLIGIEYPGELSKNVTYTYDNGGSCTMYCQGRLREVTDHSGVTSYQYDILGRVVTRTNTVTVPVGGPVALTTHFGYNDAGRMTSTTYPSGEKIHYTLDGAGQVSAVHRQETTTSALVPVATGLEYEPYGPLNGLTYGNALVLDRNYDLDGRLATQVVAGKQDITYGYDLLNNIETITDGVDATRSETFTYDGVNRLKTAAGKYGNIIYKYDGVGNRTERDITKPGQLIIEETYTYPDGTNGTVLSNRLDSMTIEQDSVTKTRSFLYDANGNLVDETRADGTKRKPQFDNTNRMDAVTQ